MAEFNPGLQELDPNYLRLSQGTNRALDANIAQLPGTQVIDFGSQKANTSVGDLLGNLTKTGAGVVKAAGDIIEQKASEDARKGVEAIRNAWTSDIASSLDKATGEPGSTTVLSEDGNQSPVTQDLGASIDRKGTQLNSARAGRKMTEADYWVQLDEFASSLRERFPGHKDFIDNKISHYAGGNPANKIWELKLSALTELAQKANANTDATVKFIEHNAHQMPKEMRDNWFSGDPSRRPSLNAAMLAIANNKADEERVKQATAQLTLLSDQKKLTSDDAGIALAGELGRHTRILYDNIFGSELGKEIQALVNKDPDQISVDETTKIVKFINQTNADIRRELNVVGDRGIHAETTIGVDGKPTTRYYGPTFKAVLGDKYQGIVDRAMGDFELLEGRIYKNPIALIPYLKGINDMKTDERFRKIIAENPSARILYDIGKVGGPFAQQVYISNEKLGGLPEFQDALADIRTKSMMGVTQSKIANQQFKSVRDVNNYYGAHGEGPENNPALMRANIAGMMQNILEKDIEPTSKVLNARVLFNTDSQEEYAKLPRDSQQRIFDRVTSPEFISAMDPVKRANAATMDQYVQAVKTQFLGLYKGELGEVNKSVDGRYATIKYDTKTEQFFRASPTSTQARQRAENSTFAVEARVEEIDRIIGRLNSGLSKLIPVIKTRNPNTADAELAQILAIAGINLVPEKKPND